ncbi:hypothetical protein HDA32_003537 [Spinactinospora alkalitolerans]|uniref:Uncharacterized protein n=1 Tax=Spinactinospora alkalitolerans TaxID=687207 RepID=A0A852TYP7_9ACTN|nr:hypothetical protein [Spinactinospora alkalitolerans]NYE48417.1 hypothetical protein [Spinactinospora alkalitolerans]
MYWLHSGSSPSVPSISSKARRVAGSTLPPRCASRAISTSTGLPGSMRGMKKFRVSATHRATT